MNRRHTLGLETALVLCSLLILIPFALIVLGSFKTRPEAAHFTLTLPDIWQWRNYVEVFQKSALGRSLGNSLIVTTVSVAGCLLCSAPAGFIIARRNTKAMQRVFSLFMLGIVAPVSIIPTILLIKGLGIYGSYLSIILLYTSIYIPWSLFFLTGFVKTIPRELDEAAVLDGCRPRQLFFRIIFPLLTPVLATNMVFIAMTVWNDFMMPLYFFSTAERWTMPLMVYNFFGQYFRQWNYVFACLILTSLPISILYLTSQRYIISGMTSGSVKG